VLGIGVPADDSAAVANELAGNHEDYGTKLTKISRDAFFVCSVPARSAFVVAPGVRRRPKRLRSAHGSTAFR
jgi:hypothetical protein